MPSTELIFYTLFVLGSFTLTFILVPKISSIMYRKKILDQPNSRSSHNKSIPNLGGIAFFIILMLGFFFIEGSDEEFLINSLTPGLTILFILGLKDDLLSLSPRVKLIGQLVAASFLVSNESFVIKNFHGLLGLQELPYIAGLLLTAFLIIAIINAFNLIDGIDGLASVIAFVIFSSFAIIFALSNRFVLTSICLLIIGSILAFLRYNLSEKKKIFMGDTGSMILGFVIAMMSIQFINLVRLEETIFISTKTNIPYILLAILVVPLFDTLRVFLIRIFNKKGPFSPDRNHTHHILIDFKGFSHLKASLIIASFNILVIILFIAAAMFFNQQTMLVISILLFLALTLYFFIINKNYSARRLKYRISKLKKDNS